MEHSFADRIRTFRNNNDPYNATPTAESYGFNAVPLNVALSSFSEELEEPYLSSDIDGVIGHCHLGRLDRAVTRSSIDLVKNAKILYLQRSKYIFSHNGDLFKMSDLQCLKIAHLSSESFGVFKIYLALTSHHDNLVNFKMNAAYIDSD